MKPDFKRLLAGGLALSVLCVAGSAFAAHKDHPLGWQRPDMNLRVQKDLGQQTDEDLLTEDFESGMPVEWSTETAPDSPGWDVGDATDASSQYMPFPEHTDFAWINSDMAGEGVTMDDWLITPYLDFTDAMFVFLDYESFFVPGSGSYEGWGEVAIRQGGGDWVTVFSAEQNDDWELVTVDLSDYAGQDYLELGFHYWDEGNWAYGWGVDDVLVYTADSDIHGPEITLVPHYYHLEIGEQLVIEAEIVDPSTVQTATMHYRVNAEDWAEVEMVNSEGDTWTGTMPYFENGDIITYYVTAVDFSENQNESETQEFELEAGAPVWMRVDDHSVENSVGVAAAEWAGGVLYDPGYYPVTLYSLEIFMANAENGVEIHVWSVGDDGMPDADLITPITFDFAGGDFEEVTLDEWPELDEPFIAGLVSQGNFCGLDEDGYFFEGRTLVGTGDPLDWFPLSDAGFPGNYYIRAFVDYAYTGVEGTQLLPAGLDLSARPNPFNPSTTLEFTLPDAGQAHLAVYNIQGQLVDTIHDGFLPPGRHSMSWNAGTASTGVYVAVLETRAGNASSKLLLVR